jgi:iron complex outermembrane receptor protein
VNRYITKTLNSMSLPGRLFPLFAALAFSATAAYAQAPSSVADIAIEDLLAVEVTSVSKKEEALFRAPSAIAVLTAEDIRRSGATSIPDALRLVPGLQVASIDGNTWAITARGFNSKYANKLLVLVDGRSIYKGRSSGVQWEMQGLPLDEIDRIEVIRGPGAALWGANAMNGVINIITKPARLTQGGTVTLSAGSLDRGSVSGRYGGRIGDGRYFRFYTQYFSLGPTVGNGTSAATDAWQVGHAGFRLDSRLNERDSLTASGSFSDGAIGERSTFLTGPEASNTVTSTRPVYSQEMAGLVRWDRALTEADMFLQATVDRSQHDETSASNATDIVNIDFQHHFRRGRHDIVWGAGQRLRWDRSGNSFSLSVTPANERVALTNLFAQDSITLVPDVLTVTLGSKFEHSRIAGGSVQPSVRLSYSPARHQNIWGGVSHAVRTPAPAELGMRFNIAAFPSTGLPVVLAVLGNPELDPEHMTAFEVGYRMQPLRRVQVDTTAFYNQYRDLTTVVDSTFVEATPPPLHLVLAKRYANRDRAKTYGGELLARVQPARRWVLEAAVTQFNAGATLTEDNVSSPDAHNAASPKLQWRVGSRLTLPFRIEADATVFRVGEVRVAQAPAYSRLDARLGWTYHGLTFSMVGQNLLDADHLEFDLVDAVVGSRIPRTATARVTWLF